MAAWTIVCLMMWAAGYQSTDASQQEGFVTCEIPTVKVGETATLTCRFPGNVTRRQISVQKYQRGSSGAPIPILDCNDLNGDPDCRLHDWRSTFDQNTMIREHEVIVEIPQAGPHDEREYKCQIPGYVHDKPCAFKLGETHEWCIIPGLSKTVSLIIAAGVCVGILIATLIVAVPIFCVCYRRIKKKVRGTCYVDYLEMETTLLKQRNEEEHTLLASKIETRDALKTDNSKLESDMTELTNEIQYLRDQTKENEMKDTELKLEKEKMLTLKEKLEKTEKERRELEQGNVQLQDDLKTHTDQIPKLQFEVNQLKIRAKDFEIQKSKLKTDKDDYNKQLTEMRRMDAEKKQLAKDKAELNDRLIKDKTGTMKMLDKAGGLIEKISQEETGRRMV